MSTLSVPLTQDLEKRLDELVKRGVASNKAAVMRRALERLAEEQAVEAVLQAEREPTVSGDLDDLKDKLSA